MPREALWVPPLNKLLLAPDFGTHIYAANVDTGRASKWLEAPTMNGKMIWLPTLQEIAIALPNRFEMWFIDPKAPKISGKSRRNLACELLLLMKKGS